jgi:phosphatidate cytidylyltransferase
MPFLDRELYQRTFAGLIFSCSVIGATLWSPYTGSLLVLSSLTYIYFVEYPFLSPKNPALSFALLFFWIIVPHCIFLYLLWTLGPETMISFWAIVWIHDTGAYLIGRSLGKTPLLPHISPRKTVEGFMGGIIALLLAPSLLRPFFGSFLPPRSHVQWGLLCLVLSLILTGGDLFESWLKRKAHLKDSGNFMPGHGGLLDRIDSLLFLMLSFPLLYLALKAYLVYFK